MHSPHGTTRKVEHMNPTPAAPQIAEAPQGLWAIEYDIERGIALRHAVLAFRREADREVALIASEDGPELVEAPARSTLRRGGLEPCECATPVVYPDDENGLCVECGHAPWVRNA